MYVIEWFFADAEHAVATGTFLLASAAVAQFELSRRTAQRQLRAYVHQDQLGMTDGMGLKPQQPNRANEPGVVMVLKNFGQTPALGVVSWGKIDVIERRHESTLVVPPLSQEAAATLGAGAVTVKPLWFGRPLNSQEIADIQSGQKAIYYFGRAEYRDAFRRRRFTNFRLFYAGEFPPPTGSANFTYCDQGNETS